MTLNANAIIDTLMPHLDDMENMYINVPRGSYISENSPYKPHVDRYREAERAFNLTNDLTGISMAALYGAVLAARRWYLKTDWQKCLPENDADRLLSCMMEQYPIKR
jgi:hypothetical protein